MRSTAKSAILPSTRAASHPAGIDGEAAVGLGGGDTEWTAAIDGSGPRPGVDTEDEENVCVGLGVATSVEEVGLIRVKEREEELSGVGATEFVKLVSAAIRIEREGTSVVCTIDAVSGC
jgi:hypothetical protein